MWLLLFIVYGVPAIVIGGAFIIGAPIVAAQKIAKKADDRVAAREKAAWEKRQRQAADDSPAGLIGELAIALVAFFFFVTLVAIMASQ